MAFSNGQNVQAADLNNFSVTTVTTTGDVTVGDDLIVTDDASVGGDLAVTGSITLGGVPITAAVTRDIVCGRLSLTTGVAVTTADVTAATTLYFALYRGNQIALYSGTEWLLFTIAQLSIAVPATTNQMYDVFVDYNSGTPALALTAWTNDTTRATALVAQDGVLVKTGVLTQRYVGSFRTTGVSGQTEDSLLRRLVWNFYNQKERPLNRRETTANWSSAADNTWAQANASTANQVDWVCGVPEDAIDLNVISTSFAGGSVTAQIALALNSVTVPSTVQISGSPQPGQQTQNTAILRTIPATGYSYAAWLERTTSFAITTWTSTVGGLTAASGITGAIRG